MVDQRRVSSWLTVSDELALSMSAATPTVIGQAYEVPLPIAYAGSPLPSMVVEPTDVPGATTSIGVP